MATTTTKTDKVYSPAELNAYDFVGGARAFDSMRETWQYKFMAALVENDFSGYTKEQLEQTKLSVMNACLTSSCFVSRGELAIAGWAFDFRPFMNRYVFSRYGHWEECYGFNKTMIRKMLTGVSEIHEIPNKCKKA